MTKEILNAVITLIATRGPEATSVRNVAAEAGVSVGAVQYYFRTKDELLLAAMREINQQFLDIIHPIMAAIPDPKGRLRAFTHYLAAVEDYSHEGAVIWTVFAARACVNEGLRAEHSRNWHHTEQELQRLMHEAYPEAEVTADHAALLLAVTDGVAVARAAEDPDRMTTARATAIVDAALAAVEAQLH